MRMGLAVLLSLVGCATDNGSNGSITTDAGLYDLLLEPSADPWTAGEPISLDVTVEHKGEPVEGATLFVEPWMPDHGHGISDPPSVRELGNGTYQASWAFSMPGAWELTIDVQAEPGSDTAVVRYDVQ
jgi:hypothetical protein